MRYKVCLQRGCIVLAGLMLVNTALAAVPDTDLSAPAIIARLAPEGIVDIAGEAKIVLTPSLDTARPERGGSEIYRSVCITCHGSGAAGAPIYGDRAAWAPRSAKGMAVLLDHALHGYHYMPPRGSCTDCTDAELKEAVRYIQRTEDSKPVAVKVK